MRINFRSKRAKIWLSIVVVLLVLGMAAAIGVFQGKQRWQAIEQSAQQSSHTLNAATAALADSKNRGERVANLKKLLTPPELSCQADWWFDWQAQAFQEVKDMQLACETQLAKARLIAEKAAPLDSYITDEQKILALLAALEINAKDKNWQKTTPKKTADTARALEQLQVIKPVEPVRKEALKRTKLADKAWQALAKANKRHNKTEYFAAIDTLKETYSGFGALTDVSDKQITPLIRDAVAAIKQQ